MVILGFGLTSIIRSFTTSLRAEQQSRNYLTAVTLLENKLTEILSNRYFRREYSGDGHFQDPYGEFRYKVTARKVDTSDILTEVHVEIRWGKENLSAVEAVTFALSDPEENRN